MERVEPMKHGGGMNISSLLVIFRDFRCRIKTAGATFAFINQANSFRARPWARLS